MNCEALFPGGLVFWHHHRISWKCLGRFLWGVSIPINLPFRHLSMSVWMGSGYSRDPSSGTEVNSSSLCLPIECRWSEVHAEFETGSARYICSIFKIVLFRLRCLMADLGHTEALSAWFVQHYADFAMYSAFSTLLSFHLFGFVCDFL